MPGEESVVAHDAPEAVGEPEVEESEGDEEETGELAGQAARSEHPTGERRPRRRGRRGGRRRRGGGEEGLAGSITDELGPVQLPEVTNAVADFDGNSSQAPSAERMVEAPPSTQPATVQVTAQPSSLVSESEVSAHEAEKAARRRSTVREKVSFGTSSPAEPSDHHQAPAAPAHSEASAEPTRDSAAEAAQPRRAGWWSRRFGGGE